MTTHSEHRNREHAEAVAATVMGIRGVLSALDGVEYAETPPAFSFVALTHPQNGTPDATA